MPVDRILEGLDLTQAYSGLALIGAALAAYVMQASWHDEVSRDDPLILRNARRLALVLLALSLLWSVLYLEKKVWQPWPPVLAMIAALDFLLLVRAATLHRRASINHQRQLQRQRAAPRRAHPIS